MQHETKEHKKIENMTWPREEAGKNLTESSHELDGAEW